MSTTGDSSSKPQAWFCTTGLPSDVVIETGSTTFHLHKFPLVSKSKKLHRLLTDQDNAQETGEEIVEHHDYRVSLPEFPGGADAFEAAAKFCYGVRVEITPSNVVPLRCAAEFLEMTDDDDSRENLAARCDRFLSQSVLRSFKSSVRALRTVDSPLINAAAEDLGITQRLVDAIAAKASSSDTSSLFGWPVKDTRGHTSRASSAAGAVLADSWLEELTALSLPTYKRVISAIALRDPSSGFVEASLIAYASWAIPGILRSSRKSSSAPLPSEDEQIQLLETLVAYLPQRRSTNPNATRLLFGLLRIANILRTSDGSRDQLERKLGLQLDQATLDDLLMPSYSYALETLYDVGCVKRLVGYFMELQREGRDAVVEEGGEGRSPAGSNGAMIRVGRLIDGYLSEIASDVNLEVERFCALAFALPEHARVYDDGLYRAADVYLKAHPRLSESERERVCGVVDCQKLTLEACTHAAQNERLPLRLVVQVLFFEQLQLRHAIAGTLQLHETHPELAQIRAQHPGNGDQVLRLDMDSMRSRVHKLEKECSTMKHAIEKIDRIMNAGNRRSPARGSLTKRFGCKFGTQVCDSHGRNIVEGTRKRTEEQTV